MMRRIAILSASLCFMTAIHAADEAQTDWLARYRVVFGETQAGLPTAEVEATLKWMTQAKACPKSVEVDMAEDEFPKGYGSFVHEFLAVLPEGLPSPEQPYAAETLAMSAGRYRLPVPGNGSASFRYKVVLEHDPSNWGPGPDEAPYRFEGGVFWTGRALFVTAPRSQVEVSFSAPKGQRISISFEPIAGRAGSYTVPAESGLRDSFLIVGNYREAQLKVSKAVVTLALGGKLGDSMPVVEEVVRRFMEASRSVFGGAPPGNILLVGNLGAPQGSLEGGVFGGDVSVLTDEPWTLSNAERWRPLLCHEIFHLWNGHAISFGDEQQYWFTEGATEYYAHLLPVRLGEISGERFLKTLADKAAAYLGVAGSAGLLAAGNEKFQNNALVYDGGVLAALSLDLQIRSATSDHRSLDDVLRALYREARGRKGIGLTLDLIVRTVSAVAGRPMDDFFSRYIQGREQLPLTDSLKLAGIRLQADTTELPDRNAVLWQLLLCPSVSRIPDGLLVHASKSEQIRSGDVIVEVAGSPISTFEDLRRAFRDRKPASRVLISVLREGKKMDLDVVLGGKQGDAVPQTRSGSVTLDAIPEVDPMVLKIRRSIFGTMPKAGRP